jgi:hypothetical protein
MLPVAAAASKGTNRPHWPCRVREATTILPAMRIIALIARRCLWMPPTLFGLLLIVFTVSHVIPSDPARIMAGENASAEQVAAIRHQFGLDQSLPIQFLRYVRDVIGGDMGTSLSAVLNASRSHSRVSPAMQGESHMQQSSELRCSGLFS